MRFANHLGREDLSVLHKQAGAIYHIAFDQRGWWTRLCDNVSRWFRRYGRRSVSFLEAWSCRMHLGRL